MGVLKKIDNQHFIYEEKELQILIAIAVENKNLIKDYWKKYKGKSILPNDTINGFLLVNSEDQDSLKIDFSNESQYLIKNLQKFD
jgi:hypothetical protein